jgi:hypothetical protein
MDVSIIQCNGGKDPTLSDSSIDPVAVSSIKFI